METSFPPFCRTHHATVVHPRYCPGDSHGRGRGEASRRHSIMHDCFRLVESCCRCCYCWPVYHGSYSSFTFRHQRTETEMQWILRKSDYRDRRVRVDQCVPEFRLQISELMYHINWNSVAYCNSVFRLQGGS